MFGKGMFAGRLPCLFRPVRYIASSRELRLVIACVVNIATINTAVKSEFQKLFSVKIFVDRCVVVCDYHNKSGGAESRSATIQAGYTLWTGSASGNPRYM